MGLWTELLVLQAMIGYCFVIANDLIGFYNIRDLNNMKGDLVFVKAHKFFGRIESIFFYVIMIQCIWMMVIMDITNPMFYDLSGTPGIHAMIGGIIAFCLFTFKFVIATFKKDIIYKYGKYIGPIGFLAWSISYFTSMIDYYFFLIPTGHDTPIFLPDNFWFALIFSLAIGIAIFLVVLVRRGSVSKEKRFSQHQIAFILHGITFGTPRHPCPIKIRRSQDL